MGFGQAMAGAFLCLSAKDLAKLKLSRLNAIGTTYDPPEERGGKVSEWILILMMHVGALGTGNSNALTTATFNSKSACERAGEAAKDMARGTVKEIKFVCAEKGTK